MFKYLSKAPLALAHSAPLYEELISRINERIGEYEPEPFGFKSVKSAYAENARFIVPLAEVFRYDPIGPLLRKWVLQFLPEYLSHLHANVSDRDFVFNRPNEFRMYLRFRVLQDRNGYSLAPHKDSADTLYAFLLQLSENNPKTSLFLRHHSTYSVKHSSILKEDTGSIEAAFKEFLRQMHGRETKFQLSDNQFGVSRYVAWDENRIAWMLAPKNGEIKMTKYDEQSLDIPFGSMLAIHNPLSDFAFSSSRTRFFQEHCTHGFFPCAFETRNVFLCDLLCKFSTTDDLMPANSNPDHEYFVLLKQETTRDMLKKSGFIS